MGDPAEALSLNLYTYCANNPLIYWDPSGHDKQYVTDVQKGNKVVWDGSDPKNRTITITTTTKDKNGTTITTIQTLKEGVDFKIDPTCDRAYYIDRPENKISEQAALKGNITIYQGDDGNLYKKEPLKNQADKIVTEKKSTAILEPMNTLNSALQNFNNFISFAGNFVGGTYGSDKNYGGDQTWFSNIMFQPGKDATGCGPVAAANILTYLAMINCGALYPGANNMTDEDFIKFTDELYKNYVKQILSPFSLQVDSPSGTSYIGGVWDMSTLEKGVIKYASERGINLEAHRLENGGYLGAEYAGGFIRDGLSQGSPVTMLMRFNGYAADNVNNGVGDMDMHFVTITGIFETETTTQVRNPLTGKMEAVSRTYDASMDISTWGEKRTITSLDSLWGPPTPSLFMSSIQLAYFIVK